ncbi:hypothetical protein HPP92_011430 [Vanilla planifolia]|uniref:Uncharacterized protein n=1 Tax=Vanilla planifolia TaxID=51239 RepID=A0A835R678_VANPL|nr:hypothetical protein HPP92_011700 [Vanilla planifolia]KAG0483346.1 hypothetical protein HPP92_011430 [Vanilla planifolia]
MAIDGDKGIETVEKKMTCARSLMSDDNELFYKFMFDCEDFCHDHHCCTMGEDIKLIQASEEELRTALKSLSALEIDGFWRIMSDKSMDDTFSTALELMDARPSFQKALCSLDEKQVCFDSLTERFAALFQERPKWQWKDLEPYIRDVHVPGLSTEGLLIKYTRKTQPKADAEVIFSAR